MAVYSPRAPHIPLARLSALLIDHFPFSTVEEASINLLDGYEDRNYAFKGELSNNSNSSAGNKRYVLKLLNSRDSKDTRIVNCLNKLMVFLSDRGFKCPRPLTTRLGFSLLVMKHSDLLRQYAATCTAESNSSSERKGVTAHDERQYCIRVFDYVEGDVLGYDDHPPQLIQEFGAYLGRMNACMMQFGDDDLKDRHFLDWDLQHILQLRERMASAVKDQQRLEAFSKVLDDFERMVVPVMEELETGCTHNDMNGLNVIVTTNGTDTPCKTIEGVIDFGDCVYNPYVFELGIALAYLMSRSQYPINYAKPFVQGYLSEFQLSQKSLEILYNVVMARITQSLINSSWNYKLEPSNEYLIIDAKPLWRLLQIMIREGKEGCMKSWNIL